MKEILKLDHIQKFYGNEGNVTKAIQDIDFSVQEGEFLGIMGASGSGKTTMLNCISTIEYCEKNKIADGEYIFRSHDYRHNLATLYYDNGISLQAVRDYLGHEYEEMTRQYVDYMPKKLEKASEAYFQEETHSFAAELMKGEFHG